MRHRDPRPSTPPLLSHEVKCARCNQWVDGKNVSKGKCTNKQACGVRISRSKRKARQGHQL